MLLYPRLCDKQNGEIQGKKAERFEEKKMWKGMFLCDIEAQKAALCD